MINEPDAAAEDAAFDERHARREDLVRKACGLMGWKYSTSHIYMGIRKVAKAEAVAIGLDKLDELLNHIESLRKVNEGLAERVAAQSELLGKKAERQ